MAGIPIPLSEAIATTFLHALSAPRTMVASSGSRSRFARLLSRVKAACIWSKREARMMHPPFQMRAISAKSKSQLRSALAFVRMLMPCAYATILDARSACSIISTRSALLMPSPMVLAAEFGLFNMPAVFTRWSFNPDISLESKALAMVGTGTPSSKASITVHFPVPFMPVLSRILSTSCPPPPAASSSSFRSTFAVSSTRKEDKGPFCQVSKTVAISPFESPPTFFSRS
mmetsp:Transcript_12296/g.20067  ORF Transcript_12296/g.20067 Transcript_12296/m.20067 type:complete len:230 (-) Transcript_12296:967-1656(-)